MREFHILTGLAAVGLAATVFAAPGDWMEHRDPRGFRVDKPAPWIVEVTDLANIAVGDPDGRAVALIRGRAAPGELSRWLVDAYPRTEPGMGDVRPLRAEAINAHAARAVITYTNPRGVAKRASLLAVRQGSVATVFVAAAPIQEFRARLPDLTRVLDSFRFTPVAAAPAGPAPAPLRTVTWIEPNEGAFSTEIPAGWRPQGGVYRVGSKVATVYTITRPQDGAQLFVGDSQADTTFLFPSQVLFNNGHREGQPAGPGQPVMLRFQDAGQMGQHIVRQRFGNPHVTGVQPRPDLVEIARRDPLLAGAQPLASAADVEFRLADGRMGVLSLTTKGQLVQGLGGTWTVEGIHGFVAPLAAVSETGLALAKLIASFRVNPNWHKGEAAHQAQMAAQYREYRDWAGALQQRTIEARWASQDAISRGRRDILGGTVRLKDPTTGETFETTARDRYHYRVLNADRPTVAGTDVDFNPLPQLDMRRLLQIGTETPDR
jgi:hypothetical protein